MRLPTTRQINNNVCVRILQKRQHGSTPLFRKQSPMITRRRSEFCISSSKRFSSSSSSPSSTLSVGIVHGSFTPRETAIDDAWEIYEVLNGAKVNTNDDTEMILSVRKPLSGEDFNIDSLDKSETDVLIVSTASQFGMPPQTLARFCQELSLAARTNPGCFSHLHHAVWGVGHANWFDTFMNVPRYVDQLLGDGKEGLAAADYDHGNRGFCGSTRLYARGEKGEPHLEDRECISAAIWASKMTRFAQWPTTTTNDAASPVPWNALWETHNTPHHQMVRPITEEAIMRQYSHVFDGSKKPSKFANHDDEEYKELLERYCRADDVIIKGRKEHPRVTMERNRRQQR